MESLYLVWQHLVAGIGFVAWILFVPQILRVVSVKNGAALDLKLLFGSVLMQVILLTFGVLQGVVDGVWALVYMYTPSVITISLLTWVTIEVKQNPGEGGPATKSIDWLYGKGKIALREFNDWK